MAAIQWWRELGPAVLKARSERKPLFVDFYSDTCLGCQAMDARTYPTAEVGGADRAGVRAGQVQREGAAGRVSRSAADDQAPVYAVAALPRRDGHGASSDDGLSPSARARGGSPVGARASPICCMRDMTRRTSGCGRSLSAGDRPMRRQRRCIGRGSRGIAGTGEAWTASRRSGRNCRRSIRRAPGPSERRAYRSRRRCRRSVISRAKRGISRRVREKIPRFARDDASSAVPQPLTPPPADTPLSSPSEYAAAPRDRARAFCAALPHG